jgi:hypothetical protein
MKKYIVNYIFVCLVILIVTSLLYILNNDIKEYVVGDDYTEVIEDNVHDNLNETVQVVADNRINEADSIYSKYWNYIKTQNSDGKDILNGCGSRFSSFMYDVKDKVNQESEDLDLCKNFTDTEYNTIDLTASGRNERIKATCLSEILNNNQRGLNQLMSEYKQLATPLARCGYLKNNGY